MLTAVDPTEIQEEPTSLTKVLLTELPSEDEAEDVDYAEMESEETPVFSFELILGRR